MGGEGSGADMFTNVSRLCNIAVFYLSLLTSEVGIKKWENNLGERDGEGKREKEKEERKKLKRREKDQIREKRGE